MSTTPATNKLVGALTTPVVLKASSPLMLKCESARVTLLLGNHPDHQMVVGHYNATACSGGSSTLRPQRTRPRRGWWGGVGNPFTAGACHFLLFVLECGPCLPIRPILIHNAKSHKGVKSFAKALRMSLSVTSNKKITRYLICVLRH